MKQTGQPHRNHNALTDNSINQSQRLHEYPKLIPKGVKFMTEQEKFQKLYDQLTPERKAAFLLMLRTTLNMFLLTVQQNTPKN